MEAIGTHETADPGWREHGHATPAELVPAGWLPVSGLSGRFGSYCGVAGG